MSAPQRAFAKRLLPIGQAIVGVDLWPIALDIYRRIHGIRHRTRGGTYLLADAQGFIYLLAEQSAVNERIVGEHWAHVVGLYASRRMKHMMYPTPSHLQEDLTVHFVQLGYVTKSDILDAIFDAEG